MPKPVDVAALKRVVIGLGTHRGKRKKEKRRRKRKRKEGELPDFFRVMVLLLMVTDAVFVCVGMTMFYSQGWIAACFARLITANDE